MPNIKLVVFDIAGTIMEDRGEILGAFRNALNKNGIPFTKDELKEWKGASKREVIHHFIQREMSRESRSAVDAERTYQRFRSELGEIYKEQINPVAGAECTLAWCFEHGI